MLKEVLETVMNIAAEVVEDYFVEKAAKRPKTADDRRMVIIIGTRSGSVLWR